MYLFLNTSSNEQIDFIFATKQKIVLSKHLSQPKGKRVDVLFELSKALKSLKKTPKNIQGIGVVVGPGYFSHLRTGIAIANTFLFANATPILGIHAPQFPCKQEEIKGFIVNFQTKSLKILLTPEYGKEPSITIKKKYL